MHRLLPAVVLGVALGGVCLAQTPQAQTSASPPVKPPSTGVIAGTVVDASTDKPIGGAIVSISGTALADSARVTARQVLTGSDGRYIFMQLPAGMFLLTATQGGYLSGGVGASTRGSTGAQVALTDGEIRPDTKLALRRPASISGIVVDDAGEPVIGAQVGVLQRTRVRGRVTWSSGPNNETTDDRGMYRVSGLAPGDYLVVVDQVNATVPTAAVDESQKLIEARGGMEGSTPPIMAELFASGGPTSGAGTSSTRMVNGQLQSLSRSTAQPGVDATGHMFVYPATLYPSATAGSKGSVVTVKSGEERSGIDIALRPVKTSSVSGTVLGPGGPASFVAVNLVPTDNSVALSRAVIGQVSTMTDARGTFTFVAVPAGDYVLKCLQVPALPSPPMVMSSVQMADGSTRMTASSTGSPVTPPLPPDPTLFVEQPVSVGAKDISGLAVTLRAGARISGHVRFAGGLKPPTPQETQSVSLSLSSASPVGSLFGRTPRVRVDANGEITSQGFAQGEYTINVFGAPQGWALQSITVDGVDVTQQPLEIGVSDVAGMIVTFTDTPADLTGAVTNRDGSPAKEAAVIAFPADEPIAHDYGLNPRRVVSTRVVTSGAFALRNLPPGDYQVVAVDDIAKAFDLTPEFIQSIAGRATRVKISPGAKTQQTLQLVSVK
jgi:hypothetical protein